MDLKSALSVLLVEDDRIRAEALARHIEAWGHRCRQVHDGRAAIGVAREMKPDLALVYLTLPGIDGF